jgi:hypothetical protein
MGRGFGTGRGGVRTWHKGVVYATLVLRAMMLRIVYLN